jgi:hypothetical protein
VEFLKKVEDWLQTSVGRIDLFEQHAGRDLTPMDQAIDWGAGKLEGFMRT